MDVTQAIQIHPYDLADLFRRIDPSKFLNVETFIDGNHEKFVQIDGKVYHQNASVPQKTSDIR